MPQLAHQLADGKPQLDRPSAGLALPERHLARLAGGGRYDDAVVRDLLDAPGRRAKQKRFARARLEHHFFVELADAGAVAFGAEEKHAIEAAIGNRAGIGDGDLLCALPSRDRSIDAIPGDARSQLSELVGWIAS